MIRRSFERWSSALRARPELRNWLAIGAASLLLVGTSAALVWPLIDGDDPFEVSPTPIAVGETPPGGEETPVALLEPPVPVPTATPTPDVAITPAGDEVPRLAPILFTFREPPPEDDPALLVSIEPAPAGTFAWLDDSRLLFQPDLPGLERGARYRLAVNGEAAGLSADHVRTVTVAGQLAVASVIPAAGDVEVPEAAQILVQFNRGVAPLTFIDEARDEPLIEFDPPLAGSGEWLNTSLYRFVPDALEPSTTYHLRVPAGVSSAADGALEADYEWSFTTFRPALETVFPADRTKFVSRHANIELTFNQSMALESIQRLVRIQDSRGETPTGAWSATEDGRVLTFDPSETLKFGERYRVTVPRGLRSTRNSFTSAERIVSFDTLEEPRVISTTPGPGAMNVSRFGVTIRWNNPMDLASFEDLVTISGIDPDDLRPPLEGESEWLSIGVRLQPETEYTVTVAPGGRDRDGQRAPGHEFTFTTGAINPSLSLARPGALGTYSSSAVPELYYYATNLDEVTFELFRLSDSEARSILSVDGIPNHLRAPYRPASTPIRTWTERLDDDANTVQLHQTLLSETPLPKGDYYLLGNDSTSAQLYFRVVDVALVTKLSYEELLVWALDYDTGAPLGGVEVEAFGPGLDGSLRTNGDGLVSFEVPSPLDSVVRTRQRAYLVTVEDGGHLGAANTNWTNGAAPWELGVPLEYEPREFVGQVYSDRPIYRPGETVLYKGIVRRDDDANYTLDVDEEDIRLRIWDARGNQLLSTLVELSEFGTFEGELELPEDATIGEYRLELQHNRGARVQRSIASNSVRVAEFRKPEFEVTVTPERSDYIDGETARATTTATFFFGGALEGAQVEWAARMRETRFRAEGYEDYSFSDFDYYRPSIVQEAFRASGRGVTDATGRASFEVPAALEGRDGTQTLEISAAVRDLSDQVIAGSTAVTVHPADHYAGIRIDSRVGRAGQATELQVVTVDTQGEPLADRRVRVQVLSRRWVTTKVQTDSGARHYTSEPVDTLLTTLEVRTGGNGEAVVEYTPAEPGSLRFVAVATDARGRTALSSTTMWVSGRTRASWRVRNDDVLDLIADRDSYEVGDIAEVLVPAPFEGALGLVTIERGNILSREVREFPTNSERLQIEITEAHVPNVFVSVVLYRPPTEEDPLPRYRLGYVELPVSTVTRELTVEVQPTVDRARPGGEVEFSVDVTDHLGRGTSAEVSVAVVDQALLSLAEERGPDGLRAFWFQRGLGVRTASSLARSIDRTNDVIAETEAGGKGGGNAATRLREDFRNTALWIARLVTDADGHAVFTVPLPDNLTTWRAQVRGVSGDTKVGEGTAELLVTQPLLLRPALPRFLRVGDEATLRLLVTNGLTTDSRVAPTIEVDGLELLGTTAAAPQLVAPGGTQVFEWPVAALLDGEARVTFRADGTGGVSDAVAITLPVYLDVTPETTATNGVVTDAAALEAVFLPDYALPAFGGLEVSVQPTLVGALDAELWHLRPPRYGPESTTSIASRIIATVAVQRARRALPTATVRGDVALLVARQRSDGGWGWCAVFCQTDPLITAWVLNAIGEAQQAGVDVDASVTTRASRVIRAELRRVSDVEEPPNPNVHAYLLHALTVAAASNQGLDTVVQQQASVMRGLVMQERAQLTNWGRAYLMLGLLATGADAGSPELRILLNDLTADTIASANGNHWEDERRRGTMHNSTALSTALVLRAISEFDIDHPLVEETARWLVVARQAEGARGRIERAQAVSALASFAEATGELEGAYEYSVQLQEAVLLDGAFTADQRTIEVDSVEVPLGDLALGGVSRVTVTRDFDAPGRLYYGLNLRYVVPAQDVEARSRGIGVAREYTLLEAPDERVTSAPLGAVVRVRLTVTSEADRKFVRLDDLLPAGLEPIDPDLDVTPPALREELERERRAAVGASTPSYYAPWYRWYYSPWDHVQVADDRATLFATNLRRGVHEYVFFARATTPGDFYVGPAVAEEAFFPEVFGRSDSTRFTVTR